LLTLCFMFAFLPFRTWIVLSACEAKARWIVSIAQKRSQPPVGRLALDSRQLDGLKMPTQSGGLAPFGVVAQFCL
jgi:hypothetical protein